MQLGGEVLFILSILYIFYFDVILQWIPTKVEQVCITFCAMMQPSYPELSLVMGAGITSMTLGQRNNPPTGKVQTHREQNQGHAHNFL
jgi:hypothetical protein